MSGEIIISPQENESYEKWKKNGRIKLSTVDLYGFIGMFILGWLLYLGFYRAGKPSRFLFLAFAACLILGRELHYIFWLIGGAIYLGSWYYIHGVVKRYEKAYELEQKMVPVAG
jgi:hypothetical protein